jgi:hypothetical protein
MASGIVHVLLCLISSGVTVSALNISLKGEKFVALDTAVKDYFSPLVFLLTFKNFLDCLKD